MCRKASCKDLATTERGYCSAHDMGRFDDLTAKKEEWKRKFYSSWKWRKKSLSFRKKNPFCESCFPKRIVAELVHHDPSLEEIVESGLDPFDDQYLHSSCLAHHQRELTMKKVVKVAAGADLTNLLKGQKR